MCVYAYLDVAINVHLDATVSGEVCAHGLRLLHMHECK